jgi:hypothetical protein
LELSAVHSNISRSNGDLILNLFFEDKDDRWLPGDRYARQFVRRMLFGKPRPSGQVRVFLNLCAGLDKLGIRYRVNNYRYIKKHPDELACILGRPFVLNRMRWKNPIMLGAVGYDHPSDDPDLLSRFDIRRILVPSEWAADMFRAYWPNTQPWPVGIDTDLWQPSKQEKSVDVLLYDKVHWDRDRHVADLVEPIRAHLKNAGCSVTEIRYGFYREEDYQAALTRCRAMIFLCQNESQGIAYQQALSSGVPIFAWNPRGVWQDPNYFPDKVHYAPVTSIPYWDERCGMEFVDFRTFEAGWQEFSARSMAPAFAPRQYILENMTLEKRARQYYDMAAGLMR